jgi:hypothetical protein
MRNRRFELPDLKLLSSCRPTEFAIIVYAQCFPTLIAEVLAELIKSAALAIFLCEAYLCSAILCPNANRRGFAGLPALCSLLRRLESFTQLHVSGMRAALDSAAVHVSDSVNQICKAEISCRFVGCWLK